MHVPKFMSPSCYANTTRYVHEYAAHLRVPHRYPKPDTKLLLQDALHGPIIHVELAIIEDKEMIGASFHGRNLRYLESLDFAACTLGTAFGMGLSVQDTGKPGDRKWSYPRFRVMQPRGRIIYLLRVLLDAQPWENVKQHSEDGRYFDYHNLSRDGLSKQSIRSQWEEGKKGWVPELGRDAFYEAVKLYWMRNHRHARITVSLEAHLNTIRTALELGDHMRLVQRNAA